MSTGRPANTLESDPADPDRIGFGRGLHGQVLSPPSREEASWARDVGWGGCVAFLDGMGAHRRSAPAVGEIVSVRLRFPFQGYVGQPFWCLFTSPGEPPESRYGPEGPGDLAAIRIVRCRLPAQVQGEDPPVGRPFAVGNAEILDVLQPEDLLDDPPSAGTIPGPPDGTGPAFGLMGDVVTQDCGPLRLIRATYYEELYDELLLWRDDARVHLLVAARWNVNEDAFAFGNRLLAPAELAALEKRIGPEEAADLIALAGSSEGTCRRPRLGSHPLGHRDHT